MEMGFILMAFFLLRTGILFFAYFLPKNAHTKPRITSKWNLRRTTYASGKDFLANSAIPKCDFLVLKQEDLGTFSTLFALNLYHIIETKSLGPNYRFLKVLKRKLLCFDWCNQRAESGFNPKANYSHSAW